MPLLGKPIQVFITIDISAPPAYILGEQDFLPLKLQMTFWYKNVTIST